MNALRAVISVVLVVAILGGVAVILLRPQWFRPAAGEEAAEKEAETEVPVKVAAVKRAKRCRRDVNWCFGPSPRAAHRSAASRT